MPLIILGFLKNNIKPLLYLVAACLIAFICYKAYYIIQENGRYELTIQTQNDAITRKNMLLLNKDLEIQLLQHTIKTRDDRLNALNEELNGLTDNLGEDSSDDAAPSLKELMRRLQK